MKPLHTLQMNAANPVLREAWNRLVVAESEFESIVRLLSVLPASDAFHRDRARLSAEALRSEKFLRAQRARYLKTVVRSLASVSGGGIFSDDHER